mmetsp:Transcript_5977/g.19354  ORF Transcript_5977/g.19354 Transcript_5977/m.19354 type:complete len:104 (+) Transcript_5977:471-782(+)
MPEVGAIWGTDHPCLPLTQTPRVVPHDEDWSRQAYVALPCLGRARLNQAEGEDSPPPPSLSLCSKLLRDARASKSPLVSDVLIRPVLATGLGPARRCSEVADE